MATMKLTAKLKLLPSEAQYDVLLDTLHQCNRACNWLSKQAWETQTFRQFALHKLAYYNIREMFGLSAQAAIRVIAKVADAYKLDRIRSRHFDLNGAVAYDSRLLSYNVSKQAVSVWSLDGRLSIPFVCGDRQTQLLRTQKGETDLCLIDGNFYLFATCDVESPEVLEVSGVLGVDLGIANIATDSEGNSYGKNVRERRARFHKTRRSLQKTGSKSAKRKLKHRSHKEKRFSSDVNHCISKQLVEKAKHTNRAIVLEELKGIRWRARASRQLRRELHSWAFYDLQQKLEYKATLAGVAVFYVNPAYTSQTCSVCGHCERANRKSQSEFSCKSCGAQLHADQNAAINIAAKGAVYLPNGVQLMLF